MSERQRVYRWYRTMLMSMARGYRNGCGPNNRVSYIDGMIQLRQLYYT